MDIAEVLAANLCHRTLANLGLNAKAVHKGVVPLLYHTIISDRDWGTDGKSQSLLKKHADSLPLDKWKHAR
jgi:hypothetical protein